MKCKLLKKYEMQNGSSQETKKNIVMNECMECTLNFARYIKAEER